jgi:hypothetical protein
MFYVLCSFVCNASSTFKLELVVCRFQPLASIFDRLSVLFFLEIRKEGEGVTNGNFITTLKLG